MEFKKYELKRCSVQHWLSLFKDITLRCELVELPSDFNDYLTSGGTLVTNTLHATTLSSSSSSCCSSQHDLTTTAEPGDLETLSDASRTRSSASPTQLHRPEFNELDDRIERALAALGQAGAFVKLNWHAPTDSRWLSVAGSLRCQSVEDVHLVLRASQRLHFDALHCQSVGDGAVDSEDDVIRPVLALWRWTDIHPSSEFRCFVRNRQLIGICQRDISQFFEHLLDRTDEIRGRIVALFSNVISARLHLDNFMMDVMVEGDGVILLDISPLAPPWQSLLFTWSQLRGETCMRCEQRLSGPSQPLCGLCLQLGDTELDGGSRAPLLPVVQMIMGGDSVRQPAAPHRPPVNSCDMAVINASSEVISLLRQSQLGDVSSSSGSDSQD